jgi:2-polyprenyl-3-methyl-5-hydroxy-6-metoxy-1,4-benzoquinol methylase
MRKFSYGEFGSSSILDELGLYLSLRKYRKIFSVESDQVCADLGCGYEAKISKKIFSNVKRVDLFDLSIGNKHQNSNTQIHIGTLPESLHKISLDTYDSIICNNVLEHIWDRKLFLSEIYRTLKPAGVVVVNVPSWIGKTFLEFCAFKLKIASSLEMNDHKIYFDPKDLWPLLIEAGFTPQKIKIYRHKFMLNTIAICRK